MVLLINKKRLRIFAVGLFTMMVIYLSSDLLLVIPEELPVHRESPGSYEDVPSPESSQSVSITQSPEVTPAAQASPDISKTPESTPTNDNMEKPSAPDGFIYLSEALPKAKFDVRYATKYNFTGRVVTGYLSDNISISIKAAEALKKAGAILEAKGYGILIYDAYRPKRAVDFFIEWSKQPEDNLTKAEFYPDFEKSELFDLGYLARRSAHSRGSAIDLTLFDIETGLLLDMGSPYDFLGPVSNHGTSLISEAQTINRNILKDAMKSSGFKELRSEWWHYQLIDEPFPGTYFDYEVE